MSRSANGECLTTSLGIPGNIETETGRVVPVSLHDGASQLLIAGRIKPNRELRQSLGLFPIDVGHDDIVFDLGGDSAFQTKRIDQTPRGIGRRYGPVPRSRCRDDRRPWAPDSLPVGSCDDPCSEFGLADPAGCHHHS